MAAPLPAPTKRCQGQPARPGCQRLLPATTEYFLPAKRSRDRLDYWCRECKHALLHTADAQRKARKQDAPPDLAKTLGPQLAALAPPPAASVRDTARDIAREVIGARETRKLLQVAYAEAIGTDKRPPNKDMLKLLVGALIGNSLADDQAEGPLADFDRAFWARLARPAAADGAGGVGAVDLGAGGLSPAPEPGALPPGADAGGDGSAD